MPEKTPADMLLEREGGEVVPALWEGKNTIPAVPPEPARLLSPGFYDSPTGKLIKQEMELFDSCFLAVKEFVAFRMGRDRLDVADFAQWEAGRRSPLEAAEPQIAIEVYRQVREEMRRAT